MLFQPAQELLLGVLAIRAGWEGARNVVANSGRGSGAAALAVVMLFSGGAGRVSVALRSCVVQMGGG